MRLVRELNLPESSMWQLFGSSGPGCGPTSVREGHRSVSEGVAEGMDCQGPIPTAEHWHLVVIDTWTVSLDTSPAMVDARAYTALFMGGGRGGCRLFSAVPEPIHRRRTVSGHPPRRYR